MNKEVKVLNEILEKIRKGKPLNRIEEEIRFSNAYRKDFNRLLKGSLRKWVKYYQYIK